MTESDDTNAQTDEFLDFYALAENPPDAHPHIQAIADAILLEKALAPLNIDRKRMAAAIETAKEIYDTAMLWGDDSENLKGINTSLDSLDAAISAFLASFGDACDRAPNSQEIFIGLATKMADSHNVFDTQQAVSWLCALPENLFALQKATRLNRRKPSRPKTPAHINQMVYYLSYAWTELTGREFTQNWCRESNAPVSSNGKKEFKRDAGLTTPANASTVFAFNIIESIDTVAAEKVRSVMREVIKARLAGSRKQSD